MKRARCRRLALVFATALVVAGVAGGLATPVLADDDDPPVIPAAYYGSVTIDGEPAPEGTTVTAYVDGEERGSLTVGADGKLGGPSVNDDKLEVNGDESDAGDPVTFRLDGQKLDTESSVEWESGAHQEVTLTGSNISGPDYGISIDEESTTEIQPGDNATVEAVVENTGDLAAPTTAEFALDGGDFDGDVVDKQTLEVESGGSKTVTFAVQLDEAGEYDAAVDLVDFDSASTTITVDEDASPAPSPGPGLPPAPPDPGDANIQVTDVDLSADRIDVGDAVNATATLENLGEASGLASVPLTVDGERVTSEAVSLDGGEESSLTFTQPFDEAGEYVVAVDGVEAGTLAVGFADMSVTDASVSDTEVTAGDTVEVTGTVENTGDIAGDATVELVIDGEAVDSTSVDVDAGDSTGVTFEHAFEDDGEYEVAIGDANAGTVTVSADTDTGDGGDGTPGFGSAAAVIAVFTLLAVGRYRDE